MYLCCYPFQCCMSSVSFFHVLVISFVLPVLIYVVRSLFLSLLLSYGICFLVRSLCLYFVLPFLLALFV